MEEQSINNHYTLADSLLQIKTHTELQEFVVQHQKKLSIEFVEFFKTYIYPDGEPTRINIDALKLFILSTFELGKLYYEQEKFNKSVKFLMLASEASEMLKNKLHKKNILFALGHAHFALKDLEKAASFWKQAWDFSSNPAYMESVTDAQNLGNIGRSFAILGYKEIALEYYLRARMILGENMLHDGTSMLIDISLGSMHRELGKFDQAIKYFESALETAQILNDRQNENRILNSIGIVYRDKGDLKKAKYYYEKGLEIAQKATDKIGEGDAFGNLGNYFYQVGLYKDAEENYLKALAISQDYHDLPFISRWTGNLANVYSALNQTDLALKRYKDALKIAGEIHDKDHCYLWNYNLGLIYKRQYSNLPEAYRHFQAAISSLESLRREVKREDFSRGFGENKILVYREMVNTCLQLPAHKHEAIGFAERGKGYTLTRMMAEANLQPAENVPQELQKKYKQLMNHQRDLEDKIGTIPKDKDRDSDASIIYEKYVGELLNVRQRQLDNFKEIAQHDPLFVDVFEKKHVTVEEIQDHLKSYNENTVVIEFWVTHEKTNVFVFSEADWRVIEILEFDEQVLNRLLQTQWFNWYVEFQEKTNSLRGNCSEETWQEYTVAEENWFQAIKDMSNILYWNLWQKIENVLHDLQPENLILIPHAGLHLLPLHMICLPENGHTGERGYLLDRYNISYAPNFRTLKFCYSADRRKREQKNLLAISNPAEDLLWAETETLLIANLFKNSEILPRKAATLEAVSKLIENFNIIHFSTHGTGATFLPNSLEASLTLAEPKNSLTAQKVFTSVKIPNSHTVVLSACETGMIELDKGDEFIGLPAAFLYAGAPSVLSSLWSVDDLSTAILIHKWYENVICDKLSRRYALIDAQNYLRTFSVFEIKSFLDEIISDLDKFRRSSNLSIDKHIIFEQEQSCFGLLRDFATWDDSDCPFEHPYHWGGFVLTGNSS